MNLWTYESLNLVKKGFTLTELLVVLLIIGIVLGMTANFSLDYSKSIQFKSSKESLVLFFQERVSKLSSTNSINNQTVKTAEIWERSGSELWFYAMFESWSRESSVRVNDGLLSGFVPLHLKPYSLGCVASGQLLQTTGAVAFSYQAIQLPKRYCFQVQLDTCKLLEVACGP